MGDQFSYSISVLEFVLSFFIAKNLSPNNGLEIIKFIRQVKWIIYYGFFVF